MRQITTQTRNAIFGEVKAGEENEYFWRATIERSQVRWFDYDTENAPGSQYGTQRARTGKYSTMVFGSSGNHPKTVQEIPGIKSGQITRSLDQDIAELNLTILNSAVTAMGDATTDEGVYDEPGALSYSRGTPTIETNRWGQGATGWERFFAPDRVIRTYEGYGRDLTVPPGFDSHMYASGVWLIDTVTLTDTGDLAIKARDLLRMLVDHIAMPPDIPWDSYPMEWSKIRNVLADGRAPTGGSWWDPGPRTSGPSQITASSSNEAYVGLGIADKPTYVGTGGNVLGHRVLDPLRPDNSLYWLSTGQESQDSMVWWELDLDDGVDLAAIRIKPFGGPFTVYVSVHDGSGWVGRRKIPYQVTTENVALGAKIPFVHQERFDREAHQDIVLPRKYANVKKVRLTFSRLRRHPGARVYPYRAGLRSISLYTGSYASLGFSVEPASVLRAVGNYHDYCLSEDTEILTKRGWLGWDAVQAGDETLAVNQETGCSEWTVIDDVFRKHRRREMHSLEGQAHSSLTTPDHRWLVRDYAGRMIWTTSETMRAGQAIPMTALRGDHPTTKKYEDDFVELVAWWWTEGSLRGCGEIGQSSAVNPEYVERIRGVLGRLYGEPGPMRRSARVGPESVQRARSLSESGLSDHAVGKDVGVSNKTIKAWRERGWETWALWNETSNKRGLTLFNLSQRLVSDLLQVCEGAEKVVRPEFLSALTEEQLELYIETSLDADGYRRRDGHRVLTQASEERIRSFEMACALMGIATSVTTISRGWSLTLLKRQFTYPQTMRRMIVDYDGVIWCPTLKHHNFLARRNGKVFFTGNTDVVKWICAWSGFWWPQRNAARTISYGMDSSYDVVYDYTGNDAVLVKGRVWGSFERTGTAGVADLTADQFDKQPLLDAVQVVRDIVAFNFFADECGGIVWRMPNLFQLGNYVTPSHLENHTRKPTYMAGNDAIEHLDENTILRQYQTTLDSRNLRERIAIANSDGKVGTVIRGYIPYPTGLRRVACWTDEHFESNRECRVAADMVAAQQMFSFRTSQSVIPPHPGIQIDDQIRIFERITNETFYHYVTGITSTYSADPQGGSKGDYAVTSHWLGERPSDAWVVKVQQLNTFTQGFLNNLGPID